MTSLDCPFKFPKFNFTNKTESGASSTYTLSKNVKFNATGPNAYNSSQFLINMASGGFSEKIQVTVIDALENNFTSTFTLTLCGSAFYDTSICEREIIKEIKEEDDFYADDADDDAAADDDANNGDDNGYSVTSNAYCIEID